MMKQHFNMLWDLIWPIHQVEDQKHYQNYHQSDCPKMTDPQEGFREEDSLEEEDSLKEESLEEAEDTQEEEAHQEQDPLEKVVEDPHQFKYCNHKQENW